MTVDDAKRHVPERMVLTVVIANTWETTCRLQHENEWVPYSKRTVHIELTPEQTEKLRLRKVGVDRGRDVTECIADVFFENEVGNEGQS